MSQTARRFTYGFLLSHCIAFALALLRETRHRRVIAMRLLSILLMISLFVSSAPAAPRTLVEASVWTKAELTFWFQVNSVIPLLFEFFLGPEKVKGQEKQSERDARVTRIQILPDDVTAYEGQQISFTAVAYDAGNNPVGGVKFKWSASDESSGRNLQISQRGDFKARAAGNFRVNAEALGQRATVNVRVNEGLRKRRGDDTPLQIKNISTRDLPVPEPVASRGKKRSQNKRTAIRNASTGASQSMFAHAPYFLDDGWGSSNYWSADDPGNKRGDPPGAPQDGGAGSANFQFTAPVLSLPGRGIDITLSLTYNSRVWNKAGNNINFDIDRDWPAPGFNLGFGKMAGITVTTGGMLIDGDGTRHGYAGTVTTYNWGTTFAGHTTDGTFIDYSYTTGTNGIMLYGQATHPDGTTVDYNVNGPSGLYPTRMTDANGNYLTITYVNNSGPRINAVTDTLGRTVTFHYDSGNRLTAITGPGFDGGTRTLVRFHYSQLALNYSFVYPNTPITRESNPWVIDAILYPATNTGYWLSQSDNSYSTYGMLKKVSERRGMTFSGSAPVPPGQGPTDQGTITAGQITREEVYNYPLNTSDTTGTQANNLSDAPTFTSCTESWTRDGTSNMDQAVTSYSGNPNGNPRTVTVTLPNGTTTTQYSYNSPGSYLDGLIYLDETKSGTTVLSSSSTSWASGAYSAPRPTETIVTNQQSQITKTTYIYGTVYNQVTDVRNYDFGGTTLVKSTRTEYQNSSSYTSRHIFSLPLAVEVFTGDNTRVSRLEYQYDGQTLTDTSGVIMHDEAWNPHFEPIWIDENCYLDCSNTPIGEPCDWVCDPGYWWSMYDSATDFRGNVTQITAYVNAANQTGAVSENRQYDITGNMVKASSSCCQAATSDFTVSTYYAYPIAKTSGSATDPLHQVKTSEVYDFNTGVPKSTTDANNRTSQTIPDPASLRPLTVTLPGGAHTDFAYDDAALSVTETTYLEAHPTHTTIAEQTVKFLHGNGQVRQEKALGQSGVWDIVDTIYDSSGRVSQRSLPYRSGDTIRWSTTTYDALSRVISTQAPDGSTTQAFYNESTRPSVASSSPGETIRMVDAWGRERWGRVNWQGKLVDIVEPDPNGNGSVASDGMKTTYSYDTQGNLISVIQGDQTRTFKYDSFGRVVAQKLAETAAAINNSGTFVGVGGSGAQWSNYFRYDVRSNVVQALDGRGVKTNFWYFNPAGHTDPGDGTAPDPLNRLQAISYDTILDPNYSLTPGQANYYLKVLPAPTVTYQYRTKSSGTDLRDVTQLASITTAGVSTTSYSFDPSDGRVLARTLTLNSRPSHPFSLNYTYDSLERVSDFQYPNEYGNGSALRKWVHRDFDIAGRVTSLTFNGQSHASNFVYNAASQMTQLKVGVSGANQITENYSFDAQTGFLDSQTVVRGASTLLNHTYSFAGTNGKRTGQLVSITNQLDTNRNRKYEYDAVGRLKRATGGQNVNWAQGYEYDRYGNRGNAYSFTVEQYLRNFYQNALNRQPNATELQNKLSAFQSAYTQGATQFLTAMQTLGTDIFTSAEYNEPNDSEFVRDLYRTYLFREPDQDGFTHWASQVPLVGRSNVRLAFAVCPEFSLKVSAISPYAPPGGVTVLPDGQQGVAFDATSNRIVNSGWSYDAVGNQIRTDLGGGVWQVYQYDAANRLTRILADDKVTERTTYTYGSDNQRLMTYEPSLSGGQGLRTYYTTEGGAVIAEYTETGSGTTPAWSKSSIYLGPRLLSTVTPSGGGAVAIDYHHPDRLGTRLVTNGQNTNSFGQATLPFGNTLDTETTNTTNKRFTSYDRSLTTKLDYAVNRHYDPYQGRFTQIDPIGMNSATLSSPQSLNLYAYCENDPVNNSDPAGLGFFSFLKKLFKGIAKVVTSKWFVIALTVALAVITIGSAAFGWKLTQTIFINLGPNGAGGSIMLPVGTKATTLGWIKSAIQATLALSSIGFSGRTILQNVMGFAAGVGTSRILSLLPSRNLGPGGTAVFAFQVFGERLTKDQGNIVWNALILAMKALDRPGCRKYVGANAYQALRNLWDARRITYFNGVSLGKDEEGYDGPSWAGTLKGTFIRTRIVTTYLFFRDDLVDMAANHHGILREEFRALTLLHEARHVLGKGYIEPHGDWDAAIARECFQGPSTPARR